jgi:hypothetical protein
MAARGPAVLQIRIAHCASVSFRGLRIARSCNLAGPGRCLPAPRRVALTWGVRLDTRRPGRPAPGGGRARPVPCRWPAAIRFPMARAGHHGPRSPPGQGGPWRPYRMLALPSLARAGILTRRPCASACPGCLALREAAWRPVRRTPSLPGSPRARARNRSHR